MEELISRITSSVGIEEGTAQSAISTVMNMMNQEGDSDLVSKITSAIPGAEEMISEEGVESSGGGIVGMLGGAMSSLGMGGGGVMAAVGQLQSSGLELGQIQGIATEIVTFAREKVGDDIVDQLLESIPGVSKFLGE